MKYLFLIALFLTTVNYFAQETFKKVIDEKKGNEMLVGICSREILKADTSFSPWFNEEYEIYTPMIENKSTLKEKLENVNITIAMGTWCSDSRMLVPEFYKILDALEFPEDRITLICVDREKKGMKNETDSLNIERVPTFIFYDENKNELGRIIEFPEETLEIDMDKILEKE
ncbi:MAG: thioredoxin family protein [Chlorobi bacterium]|nr:thioredoxin family protein [Chlorobiota bacterium]